MNKKRLVVSALILILLAGCGGAKYAEEKTVLTTATKAMEAFTASIGSADTPDAVAGILGTFTGKIESLVPKIKAMTDEHADWETNPPEELKDTFDKFKAASQSFQTQAMPKVMQFARDNADNPALQSAIQKFGGIMSQL